MKVLKCREVGGADCDFEARGETEQELFQQAAQHAMIAHPEVQFTPDVLAKAKAAIKDA